MYIRNITYGIESFRDTILVMESFRSVPLCVIAVSYATYLKARKKYSRKTWKNKDIVDSTDYMLKGSLVIKVL